MSNSRQFRPVFAPQLYPYLFPTLFGRGIDGALVTAGAGAGDQADVGYLGSFGLKQFTNFTLSAGDTWTIAKGTSSGALMIAATGKITIAGTIIANGGDGLNGAAGSGGGGGDVAGAGTGAVANTGTATAGANGIAAIKLGHGTTPLSSSLLARGGNSGARRLNSAGASSGNTVSVATIAAAPSAPVMDAYGNFSVATGVSELVSFSSIAGAGTFGTASTSGTVAAVRNAGTYAPWGQGASPTFPLRFLACPPPGEGGGVTGVNPGEACGGGGGGGGGVIYLEADTIELVAGYSIQCNGGNGGNGYSSNGTTAVAAGGSGAGGGLLVLVCRTLIGSTAAVNLAGGTKGTGAGTSHANGLDGIAGEIYQFTPGA